VIYIPSKDLHLRPITHKLNNFEDMTSILPITSAPEHRETTSNVNALSALWVPPANGARARSTNTAYRRCFPGIALQRFAVCHLCAPRHS